MSTSDGACGDTNSTSENQIPDKRYRKLSYQLFGNPKTSWAERRKCPFVNLSGRDGFTEDFYLPSDNSKPRKRRRYESMKTYNTTGPLGRCLICYSIISKEDRKTALGLGINKDDETPSTLAAKKKEKCDSLLEFLSIISLSVPILNKHNPGSQSTKAVYENAVKRLSSRPWFLCVTCDAACNQLLSKYREMKALQQEVNAYQAKFLSAIKLSRALAEKDPKLRKNLDDESDEEDKEEDLSSNKSVDNRTKLTLRMKTVDMVRKCLLGGKASCLVDVKPLLEYVHFTKEVERDPESLALLNMQKIGKIPEKKVVPRDEIKTTTRCGQEKIKSTKRIQKPYGPRPRKSYSILVTPLTSDTPVKNENLGSCSLSAETPGDSGHVEDEKIVFGDVPSRPKGKRGSYRPRKKNIPDASTSVTPPSFSNTLVKSEVEEVQKYAEEDCDIFSSHFDDDNFEDAEYPDVTPDDNPCSESIASTNPDAPATTKVDSRNTIATAVSKDLPLKRTRGSYRPRKKKVFEVKISKSSPPLISNTETSPETSGAPLQNDDNDDNIPSDFDDEHFVDDPDDPDFTPDKDPSSKNITSSTASLDQSTSATSTVDVKTRERRLRYKRYYRNLRETYPNMTFAEISAHLRKIRPTANPFRRGLPGKRRRPISEIAARKGSFSYVQFRMTYGETMSDNAYRKLRTQKLKDAQKINEEGIPSRGNVGHAGLKANWKTRNGVMYHRGVEIKKNENDEVVCPYCNKCYPAHNKNALGTHINRYHLDLSDAHECDQCDKKFYYHNDLLTHKKTKHGGGYQCETCGANLANRSALYYHKKVKHEGIKPHVCDHCGKGFASRKDLTIHVRRHTGERPFVCHVCAETFVEKQSMKLHIRKKHPEAEPHPDEKAAPTRKKSGKGIILDKPGGNISTAILPDKHDIDGVK